MKLEIHHYHHFDCPCDVAGRLEAIERKLNAMHEEMTAFFTRLDKATDAIAARLEKLTTDPALPAEIKAKLEEEITRLEAMGKDPENPLPTA
jgi:hypothetical protein